MTDGLGNYLTFLLIGTCTATDTDVLVIPRVGILSIRIYCMYHAGTVA